jgi:hypothetical protein
MEQKKRDGRGGRLTRSETVTVRFDPKLRYLAELGARTQRRTLSSFVEWAVEAALDRIILSIDIDNDTARTIENEAGKLWDIDEAERLVRLAILYPGLLTYQEQEIWKMLNDSGLFGKAKSRDENERVVWDWTVLEDWVFPRLRLHWGKFMEVASGEKERWDLPTWFSDGTEVTF